MSEENRPTIRTRVPLMVGPEVEALRKAMKGMGTDEATIIRVLTNCSCKQRQVIAEQYKKIYDRDLIKDLKKELSGEFENVVLAVMTPTSEYLSKELEHAIKTKKGEVIVQILFACEPNEMRSIKEEYEKHNDDTLEEDLKDDLKGVFEEVLVASVKGHRSDGFFELVSHDIAQAILKDEHGVNREVVVKAFSSLSFRQLRGVFIEYYKMAGRTLGEAFDLAYKGNEKTNMQALFQCISNRHGFLAAALKEAIAGVGTKDRDLIRLVVSRSEVDLLNIKDEFYKMYNRSLDNEVKGDTSGDYKKMLLALLQPNH